MCVEELALQERHASPVLGVSGDGVADGREVDPDLVGPSGVRFHLQHCEPFQHL